MCSSSPAAPPRERRSCAAPRSGFRRGAGARAARGRAAGRQLQLGDGSARGRADDRCPARSGRPGARRAAGHHARHARHGRGAEFALGVDRDRPRGARARGGPPRSSPTAARTGRTWPWQPSPAAGGLDAALRATDEILARARERGAALTVVAISSLRAPSRSAAETWPPPRPTRRRRSSSPRPARRPIRRPGGGGGGARGPRARRNPRLPAPAHRRHRRSRRHRVPAELPAALRLRRASRRGRQLRSRDRRAARLRARPPDVRR